MTLDELLRDFVQYEIVSLSGKRRVPLANFFPIKTEQGGILFDSGAWDGVAYLLKPDEHNACWQKLSSDPLNDEWVMIGRFEKLSPAPQHLN